MNRQANREKPAVYTEIFKIRSYETDTSGRATVQALCCYFQEAGFNHAGLLMEGVSSVNRNTAFVLTRLHIAAERMPLWQEEIEIRTWISPLKSNYAVRDFEVFDSSGRIIVRGTNSALFFDLVKRRPVDIEDDARAIPVVDRRAIDDDFRRFNMPENYENSIVFEVKYSDLDMYRHVNNVRYLDWALDSVPPETRKTSWPAEIEIAYMAETVFPGTVRSEMSAGGDGIFYHRISDEGSGRTAVLLRSRWVKAQKYE